MPGAGAIKTPPKGEDWADDSFISPPLVPASNVYAFGFFVFVLAYIWPPLVLLLTGALGMFVPYAFRINDISSTRRQMLEDFERNDEKVAKVLTPPEDVNVEKSYWKNDRGLLLYTLIFTPKNKPIEAVVCFCHGYGDNASFTKMMQSCRLAQSGIAVLVIEFEGFGHSDGQLGLILDFENVLCKDGCQYFEETCKAKFPGIPTFLMGESMGGAVAYCIYNRLPELFSGVVFLCPMCAIAPEMLPPKWMIDVSRHITGPTGTTSTIGELPVAPAKGDLRKLSFKLPERRALWSSHPAMFGRNPRLATGRELINVTKRITDSLSDFSAPFIILHGKSDMVTDPKLSQELYDKSKSKDKTIRLYEGVWHMLLIGEPEENVEVALKDIIEWVLERAKKKD